jgi:hypothetical protein
MRCPGQRVTLAFLPFFRVGAILSGQRIVAITCSKKDSTPPLSLVIDINALPVAAAFD